MVHFRLVLYTVSTVVGAYWMIDDIYRKHKRYKAKCEDTPHCKDCGSTNPLY